MTIFIGITDAVRQTSQKNSMWKFFMHSFVKMMLLINNNKDSQRPSQTGEKRGLRGKESKRVASRQHPGKKTCLLYTSPSPRDRQKSRMPSSA